VAIIVNKLTALSRDRDIKLNLKTPQIAKNFPLNRSVKLRGKRVARMFTADRAVHTALSTLEKARGVDHLVEQMSALLPQGKNYIINVVSEKGRHLIFVLSEESLENGPEYKIYQGQPETQPDGRGILPDSNKHVPRKMTLDERDAKQDRNMAGQMVSIFRGILSRGE